ncbi:MAG TPA: GIY-YIG nuclease family protein [Candidatus Paceibacterota bacterium]|nr:GIY-YIG nuclease family protein [Candidatus Paceibacterota bacterium]HRT55091.1 GIY-YIG nuclease family protein [Candidatus Paceibacterota bacterium]
MHGNLPEEKGTYVLIASAPRMKRIEIGRLGRFDIPPGFYAYVGSAFGAGGLRARLGHHLESTARPHWHIDYLLRVARPVEIWLSTAPWKLEPQWAGLLEAAPQFRVPIPGFGCSDSPRRRASHLFYSSRRPRFRWFQQRAAETSPALVVKRLRLSQQG